MSPFEQDARMSNRSRSQLPFRRYGVAVACVAIAVAVQSLADIGIGQGSPLILLLFPVLIAAWQGGTGPGLVATALTLLACLAQSSPPKGDRASTRGTTHSAWSCSRSRGCFSRLMGSLHAALGTAEAPMSSEERFRSLSDSSPVGIFTMDVEGRCTYTNPRLLAIDGLTPEAVLEDGWQRLIVPEDREAVLERWTAARSEAREYDDIYRLRIPQRGDL